MGFQRSTRRRLGTGRFQKRAWRSKILSDRNAAKTYHNPLLPERSMADPDVIRVNGHYFLYATSDTRGYEVLESDDLVHWDLKGWAFKDPRGGAWAPDVFKNERGDQKFYPIGMPPKPTIILYCQNAAWPTRMSSASTAIIFYMPHLIRAAMKFWNLTISFIGTSKDGLSKIHAAAPGHRTFSTTSVAITNFIRSECRQNLP